MSGSNSHLVVIQSDSDAARVLARLGIEAHIWCFAVEHSHPCYLSVHVEMQAADAHTPPQPRIVFHFLIPHRDVVLVSLHTPEKVIGFTNEPRA